MNKKIIRNIILLWLAWVLIVIGFPLLTQARFQPQWRPKYLCAPGGLALPRVLADAAQLIAGEGRSPA